MKQQTNKKGFTIIEVILVLAIAGLIFLIVFLALPQLQRSRRDTQRKSDTGRLVAAITQWQSNNDGITLPATATDVTANVLPAYLDSGSGGFNDPSTGGVYSMVTATNGAAPTNLGEISYGINFECSGSTASNSTNPGNAVFAVVVELEQGSYCQDNK